MQWIAPSEKDSATTTLEVRLWDAADQFRANSGHAGLRRFRAHLRILPGRIRHDRGPGRRQVFLDKGKAKTPRADTVLFIDARHIYR